jgi:hypothetical protein
MVWSEPGVVDSLLRCAVDGRSQYAAGIPAVLAGLSSGGAGHTHHPTGASAACKSGVSKMAGIERSQVCLKKVLSLIATRTEGSDRLRRAFLVFLLLMAVPRNGHAESCKVERDQDGITVESCALSGTNFRLVRGEATLKGTLAAAMKLLTDSTACRKWRDRCVSETQIGRPREYEILIQSVSDGGFFGTNRIAVVRLTWGFSPSENALIATIVGDDHEPVASTKLVRVKCIRGRWVLKQAPANIVHVTYEIVSDPEALAWFVNQETVTNVYKTLQKMQSVIQEREYSEAVHLPKDVPSTQSVTDLGQSFSQCVQQGQ